MSKNGEKIVRGAAGEFDKGKVTYASWVNGQALDGGFVLFFRQAQACSADVCSWCR